MSSPTRIKTTREIADDAIGPALDPYYLFLDVVETLGHGRAFLLDAAKESTSSYQMSLVAGVPVLEVQVKDGETSLFAEDGLAAYLTGYLSSVAIVGQPTTEVGADAGPAANVVATRGMLYRAVDPMQILEHIRLAMLALYGTPEVPFSAGFLGYIGYDAVHYLETIPKTTDDDRRLPDIRLQAHAVVIQLAHDKVSTFSGVPGLSKVLQKPALERIEREVDDVRALVSSGVRVSEPNLLTVHRQTAQDGTVQDGTVQDGPHPHAVDDVLQPKFEANVQRAKEYIAAGDIFQVVLSKRVRVKRTRHAYLIYDELRRLNPSPYMFIAEYPDMRVFGASPEVQFRCVNKLAEMKPIAGTSKGRGATKEADEALANALLQDKKERAEHVMLVDLCRNDLGRVCTIGSVKVRNLMHVEAYSHLFHLVSEVTGELRSDISVFHALLATFPAGTLSGAPKIRAMEIIDELESLQRGPYGGMIGMIDFDANANTAIVIRTIVESGDTYYVQVGAGIVADSNPEQEWLECGHKAGAVLQVLGVDR